MSNIEIKDLYEAWVDNEEITISREKVIPCSINYLKSRKEDICGKCVPCRDGIPYLEKLMTKFKDGNVTDEDIDRAVMFITNLRASKCSVGQDTGRNMEVVINNHFEIFQEKVE